MNPEDVPEPMVDLFRTGAPVPKYGIRAGLAAVLPAYEARLREQIAKEIEAEFILTDHGMSPGEAMDAAYTTAAKIARGSGAEGSADDLSASETCGRFKNCGVFQVVMSDAMKPALRAWLEARNEVLYVIPVVDDLPSFGVDRKHQDGGER